MYKYFPHTADDIRQMLDVIGVGKVDDLYADVPSGVRLRGDYDIPPSRSEIGIRALLGRLAAGNRRMVCFAGAGVYDHYTPAVIPPMVQRAEYLTSYTPYQPEISQGTLKYIFEYQTMMARLTGLPVSNASLYDGATATAEAMMMCAAISRKSKLVLVAETVDPKVREVLRAYAHFRGIELKGIPARGGASDFSRLGELLGGEAAGVIVQQPNYYGVIEDFEGVAEASRAAKALFVVNTHAADLAVLRTPGEWGADIAVGEAQSLGIPMAWGGPYLGYMTTTEKHMRKMPGRIVGQTVDSRGRRAFVLTIQAREQHIRRQNATSNICSNQSLMALWVTIYMSLMGPQGLVEVAQKGCDGAHYLRDRLMATGHFAETFPGREFLNEFCVDYDGDRDALRRRWLDAGFLGGVSIGDKTLMLAVTEMRTREEMDRLVELVNSETKR